MINKEGVITNLNSAKYYDERFNERLKDKGINGKFHAFEILTNNIKNLISSLLKNGKKSNGK